MRWLLGAIFLLIVGIALQLGLLVYAMYVLLGVMLISRYLARQWIESITVKRECHLTSAQIGERAKVTVTINNTGWLSIVWMLVEDSVPKQALLQQPPRIALEGRRVGIIQVPARNREKLSYQVRFLMRGYYQLGPLLVESGDLFGLHRRFQIHTKPHYVLVYPKVLPLVGYELASRRPVGEVRLMHRLFEDPTRISGVRPYQRGDSFNRIHWRATARTGALHCKTYEPSCIAGVTILLDFHLASYPARGEPYRSELTITAAASLANAIYQLGQQFGLVTNGRDAADRIREEGYRHEFRTRSMALGTVEMSGRSNRLNPVVVETRRGAEQLNRILETLARVELSDGLSFSQLVIEATSRLPRDATVVALLGDVPPETATALGNLRRLGYAVTVLLVMADEDEVANCMGRLLSAGIDVRQLEDEAGIVNMCSAQMVR